MSGWIPSYNTNGLAHHRLGEAVDLLAELGYGGVALTLDNQHLDPFGEHLAAEVSDLGRRLQQHRMLCTVETGARFNLDYRLKHYPSLITRAHAGRRQDFLMRSLEIASDLGAGCISLWSGHNFDRLPPEEAFDLLVEGLEPVVGRAEELGIDVAFEPEPGMFIETVDDFERLAERFPTHRFGLALDVGHLLVTGECGVGEAIERFRGKLVTVAVEDMRRGVHEHLPLGEGELDFREVFDALNLIGYRGLVSVELPRQSSDGARYAEESMRFLERFRA